MFRSLLPVAALALLLTACGGGGSGTSSTSNISTSGITLSGSVGDGPIVSATITVADLAGSVIATVRSDNRANYSVSIPAGTQFPLVITTSGGTDSVTNAAPSFLMQSVAMSSQDSTININPFTTFILKSAQSMPGGLSTDNLATAKSYVLQRLNFGLDNRVVPDPITTKITPQNVNTIVKASETLLDYQIIQLAHAQHFRRI